YFKFIFNLISGFFSSVRIIKNFKPDFILGMGGYVCAPVFLAAIFLRKKIGLHEQNFIPGRLNKFFAKFSRCIFLSFNDSKKFFKPAVKSDSINFIFSGNPVRKSIINFKSLDHRYNEWQLDANRFTIISFGGSLGAERINNSVLGLYDYYRDNSAVQFLLISGKRFYEDLDKKLSGIKNPEDKLIFKIFPYIEEMAYIYKIAGLIISRAGATTVSELIVTGIPAILIPYPKAVENHQHYNAEYLVKSGKAIIVYDGDISPEVLFNRIQGLLADGHKEHVRMSEKQFEDRKINSAGIIADAILNMA
ncbi:MAG: UDP-N-acetylglucosamine--N-acetylmuramyl-(pentapeptide) pyrophosphoryl-undecaprenol N-acetylglucosamine transferase, partial [Actinobacteria bacterium]|nr:UDP-N-acetylglucosamine--N-acetylmuramyl-(pentapeptide) pyrophosphoryl-undecaprenol N-acetylglucosamine transferase [Actinomycetota bacterium]